MNAMIPPAEEQLGFTGPSQFKYIDVKIVYATIAHFRALEGGEAAEHILEKLRADVQTDGETAKWSAMHALFQIWGQQRATDALISCAVKPSR